MLDEKPLNFPHSHQVTKIKINVNVIYYFRDKTKGTSSYKP
jgi:hypothetical protein